MQIQRGNTFVAFFMGIFLPCAGFYLIKFLFGIAEAQGLIDAASSSIGSRRFRTICIMSICLNILPMQVFQRRRQGNSIRGLAIATVLLGGIWVLYFYDSLFAS